MLGFLRRIRRSLIEEGNLRKYLVYAVGEILLVMIGILLALQVNTWNENKKDGSTEKIYLEGLSDDLIRDSTNVSNLVTRYQQRINKFQLIDTTFSVVPMVKAPLQDSTIQYFDFFRRLPSFRPIKGTYTSLVMDGNTSLIRDKALLSQIHRIYEFRIPALTSYYADVKEIEKNISWGSVHKISQLRKEQSVPDPELIIELNYFHYVIQGYCINLVLLQQDINDVLGQFK